LIVGCSFPAVAAPLTPVDAAVKLPPYTKVQLKNGMTLLLMEKREVPLISMTVMVKSGAVADPRGKEGLAAATADLLKKGTKSRSSEQIASDLDYTGGDFEMNATLDFTSGNAEFMKKDIRRGLELMGDVLMNPTFPQSEVKKLLDQDIDELKAAKDRASSVIGRYFNNYLFGTHPYARPVSGDETSLAGITRADIVKFYDTYYVPNNIVFAAVGDFTVPEMRQWIEERFATWPSKPMPQVAVDPAKTSTGRRLLLVDKPDSTQTYFYIGNIGIARTNPDRISIGVVNALFGGLFTSHLNTALRIDSGLTYGASSAFTTRREPGPFTMSSYTKNATTEQAIDLALKILKDLHEKGITTDELNHVKAYLKGQYATSLETSDQLASTITNLEFYGLDASDVDSYYAKVDSMTVEQARRIIDQYFPSDSLVFVLIGKAAEIEPVVRKYAPKIDRISITKPGFSP
jgi:predicted Zn-dependent peptidase